MTHIVFRKVTLQKSICNNFFFPFIFVRNIYTIIDLNRIGKSIKYFTNKGK